MVLWQLLVRWFEVPAFLLPAPTDVVALMIEEWPLIQMHSLSTIWSILTGYLAASFFALAISALMIRFPLVERLIMPIFVGLQSVPKIAIAPLILVRWGRGGLEDPGGRLDRLLPHRHQHHGGLQGGRPRPRRRKSCSVDATERQMFFRLRLPYAMPYIFAGLRIATTLSVLARSWPSGWRPPTASATWCSRAASI